MQTGCQTTGTGCVNNSIPVLQVRDEHLAALIVLTRLTSLRLVHGKDAWHTERYHLDISPAGESFPVALCYWQLHVLSSTRVCS